MDMQMDKDQFVKKMEIFNMGFGKIVLWLQDISINEKTNFFYFLFFIFYFFIFYFLFLLDNQYYFYYYILYCFIALLHSFMFKIQIYKRKLIISNKLIITSGCRHNQHHYNHKAIPLQKRAQKKNRQRNRK
jgi:hypothetical protein